MKFARVIDVEGEKQICTRDKVNSNRKRVSVITYYCMPIIFSHLYVSRKQVTCMKCFIHASIFIEGPASTRLPELLNTCEATM